jgi:hypothetical protein
MSKWLNMGEVKRLESPEWALTIEDLCDLMTNSKSALPDMQKEYAVRIISTVMSNLERRGLIDDQFMDIREDFKL